MGEILDRLWGGQETLIVVSSDLSHFHPYESAWQRDSATADAIERGEWAALGPDDACGHLAIAGLLIQAQRRGLEAARLSLCNSGDTAGPPEQVVDTELGRSPRLAKLDERGRRPGAGAELPGCTNAPAPAGRAPRSASD